MQQQEKFCFVIQPISDKKYDKRFVDIYEPAISNANIKAYRVDKDSTVQDIIQSIERKIDAATICFADISIDNPNVWYELGYATAKGKDIVIVCDENRNGKYPFDISHKNIIQYKSDSPSDFTELSKKITERINTYLRNQERNYKIIDSPLKECDGLQPYEISLLGVIVGEQLSDDVNVSLYLLKDRMLQIGFNETAVGIGIMSLGNKGIIVTGQEPDYHGNEYPVCKLTPRGKDFILIHTNLFELSPLKVTTEKDSSEWELPF